MEEIYRDKRTKSPTFLYCCECESRVYKINWKKNIFVNSYKYRYETIQLGWYCSRCKIFTPIGSLKIGTEDKDITRG